MKAFKASLMGMGAIALMLTACAGGGQTEPQLTASGLNPVKFDTIINGDTVRLYTLKNANGMEVCITNFGARVVSIVVPDRDGNPTDVVLGFDNIAQYADTLNSPSDYGSSVGRYANRINKGMFTLDDSTYQLKQNDRHPGGRNHCLHGGGSTGWMNRVYTAEQLNPQKMRFGIIGEDGENGFPGRVEAYTVYELTEDNTLDIKWYATSDRPTIINQTNHSYFNLGGDLEQPCYDQELYINADSFTVADDSFMPTGEIRSVEGTPMDFRNARPVGDSIRSDYDQIKNAHGFDHNWCLNTRGSDKEVCASLYSPKTGILMEMYTNEPGVQVYSGNFQGVGGEENIVRKLGKHYPQHASICLESQKYPDSPNHPEWPSPVLRAGQEYFSHAAYKFSTR